MTRKPKRPAPEPDVCVFVKTTGDSWVRWDEPFEEVVAAMAERKQNEYVRGDPTVVVEVRAIRKARLTARVDVEHLLNDDGYKTTATADRYVPEKPDPTQVSS